MSEDKVTPKEEDRESSTAVKRVRRVDQGSQGATEQKTPSIPSRKECMQAVAQLPGLIAMKVLAPSQANAIRSSYETLLKEYNDSNQASTTQLDDDAVLGILSTQPELLSMIEPLLTKDQINMVLQHRENAAE